MNEKTVEKQPDSPSAPATKPKGPGPQYGNQYGKRSREFREALKLELASIGDGDWRLGIRKVARSLVLQAKPKGEGEAERAGDIAAVREIADRIEGKSAQEITGAGGGPVQVLALTPKILAELSDDELAAIERALPALERLGASRADQGGEGPAGEAEET